MPLGKKTNLRIYLRSRDAKSGLLDISLTPHTVHSSIILYSTLHWIFKQEVSRSHFYTKYVNVTAGHRSQNVIFIFLFVHVYYLIYVIVFITSSETTQTETSLLLISKKALKLTVPALLAWMTLTVFTPISLILMYCCCLLSDEFHKWLNRCGNKSTVDNVP